MWSSLLQEFKLGGIGKSKSAARDPLIPSPVGTRDGEHTERLFGSTRNVGLGTGTPGPAVFN